MFWGVLDSPILLFTFKQADCFLVLKLLSSKKSTLFPSDTVQLWWAFANCKRAILQLFLSPGFLLVTFFIIPCLSSTQATVFLEIILPAIPERPNSVNVLNGDERAAQTRCLSPRSARKGFLFLGKVFLLK